MKRLRLPILLCIFLIGQVFAQWTEEERERINKLNQEDHQLMMKLLGITELRPGPSGDPKAQNYANTDESKATPYTSLPDPLLFNNDTPVKTPEQWEERKSEIFEDFDREIYGLVPENTPTVTWEVVSEKDTVYGEFPVNTKQLIGHVDNSGYQAISVDIQMSLTVPRTISYPVPVILEFGWILPKGWPKPKHQHSGRLWSRFEERYYRIGK